MDVGMGVVVSLAEQFIITVTLISVGEAAGGSPLMLVAVAIAAKQSMTNVGKRIEVDVVEASSAACLWAILETSRSHRS